MTDFTELERQAKEATPGPWTAMMKPPASFSDHGWRAMAMCGSQWMVAAPKSAAIQVEDGIVVRSWNNEANAALIVAAVNALPRLLEIARAAEEFVEARESMNRSVYRAALAALRSALHPEVKP